MSNVAPFEPFSANTQQLIREQVTQSSGNGGGGNFGTEIRVSHLEEDVKEIKFDLKSMKTDVYAVKSDIAVIKNDISSIQQTMGTMVSKADLTAAIKGSEASQVKWLVSTMLAGIGLAAAIAFGIAKLV